MPLSHGGHSGKRWANAKWSDQFEQEKRFTTGCAPEVPEWSGHDAENAARNDEECPEGRSGVPPSPGFRHASAWSEELLVDDDDRNVGIHAVDLQSPTAHKASPMTDEHQGRSHRRSGRRAGGLAGVGGAGKPPPQKCSAGQRAAPSCASSTAAAHALHMPSSTHSERSSPLPFTSPKCTGCRNGGVDGSARGTSAGSAGHGDPSGPW